MSLFARAHDAQGFDPRASGAGACLALGVLSLLMFAGCEARTTVDRPLMRDVAGSDPASQMDFWHALPEQPITSNDAAFHGLLLYFDGQDDAADYEQRRQRLIERGWLAADFQQPADQAVSRGTLAVALAEALDIDGGLTMRVFGPSPRYAVRELEHVGIYPRSAAYQTFTGDQFTSLIGRVEDYQRQEQAMEAVQAAQPAQQPEPEVEP